MIKDMPHHASPYTSSLACQFWLLKMVTTRNVWSLPIHALAVSMMPLIPWMESVKKLSFFLIKETATAWYPF